MRRNPEPTLTLTTPGPGMIRVVPDGGRDAEDAGWSHDNHTA